MAELKQSPAARHASRMRRHRLSGRRVRIKATAGLLALGVLGIAWIIVTGVMARSEAAAAQSAVNRLRSQLAAADLSQVGATADDIRTHAHRAHALTSGPAWWAAAHLPWVGRPLETGRGCAAQVDVLAREVLAPLVAVSETLDVQHLVNSGSVRVQPLLDAAPTVSAADSRLRTTTAAVAALPSSSWLSTVDTTREHLLSSLQKLQGQLDAADRAASVLPEMLGAKGTKRYFVGLENEAESRGLGGIPGAFSIVTAENGRLTFTRFESDTTLTRVHTGLDLGTEFERRYSAAAPADTYPNSTISPDFRDAAQIWAAMWKKYSGQEIDGAVAIDPTAISYLLRVTGPAALTDGTAITADNVVALTQKTLYRQFPNTTERKNYLLSIASAISTRLVTAKGSTPLIHAATRAASERRLMIWSRDAETEQVLRQTSMSGTIDPAGQPFSGFTTVNATGGKLDYYLRRSASYIRTGCGNESVTTATITLHNDVPAGSLPAYVTLREDHPPYPTQPGDNKLLVSYYATGGSRIDSVTVDGISTIVAPGTERGLTVFTLPVELKRGSTRTIVVRLHEPTRAGAVQILRQPAVNPIDVTVSEPSCG
jgi:hypothetical protein